MEAWQRRVGAHPVYSSSLVPLQFTLMDKEFQRKLTKVKLLHGIRK